MLGVYNISTDLTMTKTGEKSSKKKIGHDTVGGSKSISRNNDCTMHNSTITDLLILSNQPIN